MKSVSKFATRALLGFWTLLCVCLAQAQQAPAPPPPNPQLTAIERRLDAIEHKVEPTGLDARLARLEDLLRGLKPTPLYITLLPSAIAFIGALVGVWVGGRNAQQLQNARLVKDDEAAEKKAKLEIASSVVEFELKQLSLLYGPLRALLGQSEALYREMNKVLLGREDKRFRMVEQDGQRPEFQIQLSAGQWTRFRTVLHIFEVYGKGYGVESYFDEIIAIGAEMVKVIQQQAGYARREEKELMTVFGKYLAHFAVLKSVQEAAKNMVSSQDAEVLPTGPQIPAVNPSAAFPDTIHTLVNQGFEAITQDIQNWQKRAAGSGRP